MIAAEKDPGSFEVWWGSAAAGNSALLLGGEETMVLGHLLQAAPSRPTVVADQRFAGVLSVQMSAGALPKAEVRLSRGLTRDLGPGGDRRRPASTLIIPSVTLASDTSAEVNRLGAQLRLLAGYDTPPLLVRDLALSRFAAAVSAYMMRRDGLLIVHDAQSLLSGFQPSFTSVFPFLDKTAPAGMAKLAPAGSFATVDLHRPAPNDVLKFSEFLVKTPEAVLRDMHMFMAGPAALPIFQNWRSNLVEAASVPGYELYIELALERLDGIAAEISGTA